MMECSTEARGQNAGRFTCLKDLASIFTVKGKNPRLEKPYIQVWCAKFVIKKPNKATNPQWDLGLKIGSGISNILDLYFVETLTSVYRQYTRIYASQICFGR